MSKEHSQYDTILDTENLSIGYATKGNSRTILEDINVHIHKGEIICLIGPNGCGKSTLIRTLAGMQAAIKGSTVINGKQVDPSNIKSLATQLSVVLTDRVDAGNLSVSDIVELGRFPYTNWIGKISTEDEAIVKTAIEHVGLLSYFNTPFSQLSDGEKQRVMIAKALAQNTPLIMLDEPTAHLDLPNRVEIMKLLRELAHKTVKSILLSTHELDLALQAADRIWLMNEGKPIITGTPEDLVLNGSFEKAFKKQSFDFDMSTGTFKINYNKTKSVRLEGDQITVFWTKRALERHGYAVTEDSTCQQSIKACEGTWLVCVKEKSYDCSNIMEVLSRLSFK